MKALLLALLISGSAFGQSFKDGEAIVNWTLIGESHTGKLYFSPDTTRRNGDVIKVWIRIDFPLGSDAVGGEPLRAGRDFGSIRGYGIFNCADLTVTSNATLVLYYDRSGRLVKKQKEPEQVKGDNGPNGLTAVFRYFCESVEVPPSGPPKLRPKP